MRARADVRDRWRCCGGGGVAIVGVALRHGAVTCCGVGAASQGPYQRIGAVFDAVETLLAKQQIPMLFGIGLYFDAPCDVKAEELRSYAGYAVDPKSLDAAGTQEWLSAAGLLVKRIPATKAITCDFPFRSHWSFPLSAMRVYPASAKVRTFGPEFKGVASVEIYNPRPPLSNITFAFPYASHATHASHHTCALIVAARH